MVGWVGGGGHHFAQGKTRQGLWRVFPTKTRHGSRRVLGGPTYRPGPRADDVAGKTRQGVWRVLVGQTRQGAGRV